jgi:DNA-binding CsgD family transcriptional regulator
MSANMTDAIAGGFNTRMIDAGKMQMIISEASMEEDNKQIIWMFGVICSFIIILILVITLFVKNVQHSRRQKEIKDMLLEANSRLKVANSDLKLANRIKDSYVFSYMELAITYLQKLEDSRREVRSIAKNEGLEAVIKVLRSPSYIYEEYKHYYKVFDEAFLGIFPDFREKVNALLREDARFPVSDAPVLCTELRVLAAIRLGITESGKIATFLNCAPTTIYTYRTRLKRAAICPKDEFEAVIASI